MWIDHGWAVTSTTHIENLVDAIQLALTKGRPGEAYFILDERERSMKAMLIGSGDQRGCRPAGTLHPVLAGRHDCGGVGGCVAAIPAVGRPAAHPACRHGNGPRLCPDRHKGQERTWVSASGYRGGGIDRPERRNEALKAANARQTDPPGGHDAHILASDDHWLAATLRRQERRTELVQRRAGTRQTPPGAPRSPTLRRRRLPRPMLPPVPKGAPQAENAHCGDAARKGSNRVGHKTAGS